MICGGCCKYIKLKCFFYLQIISSRIICKKNETMINPQYSYQFYQNNIQTSTNDDDNDYGHFYDTETNTFNHQEKNIRVINEYDNAYDEYLDNYERAMRYENLKIDLMYDTEDTIFNKIMEKGLVICFIQYIFSLCNSNK